MSTDVAIVGAGPYGLSVAAHLRSRDVDFRIFGQPLLFWRRMLRGINLKSPDFGSNIYTPGPGNTFIEWCDARGLSREEPIPMSRFTDYLVETQRRVVPGVEQVEVTRIRREDDAFDISLGDGTRLRARRVVVAVGLAHFARTPGTLSRLPPGLVTHTSEHTSYDGWSGKDVVVVGAGQSAIEAARALLDAGAAVTVVSRRPPFFTPVPTGRPRTLRQRLRRPRTAMGESLLSYSMQHVPLWPHFLPDGPRVWLTRKHLGPYATWWLRDVAARATFVSGVTVDDARVRGGRVELRLADEARGEGVRTLSADSVVCGTGYEIDIDRLPFLAPELARRVARIARAPRLTARFESSIPGLYFVGPASSQSFGPFFRFVCGAEYAAPSVARHLAVRPRAPAAERGFQPR